MRIIAMVFLHFIATGCVQETRQFDAGTLNNAIDQLNKEGGSVWFSKEHSGVAFCAVFPGLRDDIVYLNSSAKKDRKLQLNHGAIAQAALQLSEHTECLGIVVEKRRDAVLLAQEIKMKNAISPWSIKYCDGNGVIIPSSTGQILDQHGQELNVVQ